MCLIPSLALILIVDTVHATTVIFVLELPTVPLHIVRFLYIAHFTQALCYLWLLRSEPVCLPRSIPIHKSCNLSFSLDPRINPLAYILSLHHRLLPQPSPSFLADSSGHAHSLQLMDSSRPRPALHPLCYHLVVPTHLSAASICLPAPCRAYQKAVDGLRRPSRLILLECCGREIIKRP